MVLCLVLGEEVTDRFIFDISVEMWTSMKISHLRDGIKEKASLSVPAHKIKLWKVAIPTKDMNDEKMKILINKSHESINVEEELGGELLDAEDSISSKIENVPADNHIHIIVEPPPPATTGKCLPMVYLSNKKFALSHILYFLFDKENERQRIWTREMRTKPKREN